MKDNKKEKSAGTADVTLEGTIQTEGNDIAPTTDMQLPDVSSKTGVKEVDQPKSIINTKKAAEAVAAGNTSANGSAPATFSRGGVLFSGGAGQVGSDLSATTRGVNSYRSSDRTGKRLDPITKKLDLLNAEVIKTKVYESKPLAETDSKQGYNGNYQNEHAITQKVNGGHPADPLFERSADEIRMDMLYYADGQYVNTKESYDEYDINDYDVATSQYKSDPIDIGTRGSYFNRSLKFKVSKPTAGKGAVITDFTIDSYNASATGVDELTSRASSDAALRNVNLREMDRIQMIANAGNESDPKWSCLGDVIYKASAQNTLLADIDATTGDMVYASRRKLAQSLAYQINKTAKDGSRIAGPIAEMCNGLVALPEVGSTAIATEDQAYFNTFNNGKVLQNGGAGLWLRLNDSVNKYTTKAKLLNLPLSFKSALNVATANCDPLRMHSELLSAIEKNELFSTIDGPYDPLKPVVHTDALSIITPFDFSKQIKKNADGTPNFDIYTMHYENLRNRYNIKIKNFFLSGIYRWISERADRLYTSLKDTGAIASDGAYEVTIPMTSSSSCISLWDLIVCSAVPYMVEDRITSFTEVLKYERNFAYPYSKTISLKDTQVCHSENFSFVSADEALTTAIAKPIAAMKVIMPEIFWCVNVNPSSETIDGKNGRAVQAVLPHYFVQNQFVYDRDITEEGAQLLLSDDYASMAYPSTRSGAMFGYMDTIYGMSEEDYRLSLDRMTVYPAYQGTAKYKNENSKIATTGAATQLSIPSEVYKYGLTADGQPVIPYFAWANSTDDVDKALSVLDVISTPREMGLMMVAPAGLLTPIIQSNDATQNMYANTVSPKSSFFAMSGPGFKVITYHAIDMDVADSILGEGTTNVDIAGSLRAVWEMICANYFGSQYNKGWAVNAAVGNAAVSPFTVGSFTTDSFGAYDESTGTYGVLEKQNDGITLQSSARYMWTRLQRLPFAINPFDANSASIATAEGNINTRDIFDFLYMLGLCGFRASDYTALVNERVKQRIIKGMDYVTDPFVEQTSLLK